MSYVPSNYATAPTPGMRPYGTKYSVPFMWQDQPGRTTHLKNIEPHPALPVKRLYGAVIGDGRWQDAVVIEQGEPVGIYRDPTTGRQYIVPATGSGAATATYTSVDVDQLIESLDTPGVAVAAAGTTSASFTKVFPIGVANAPIGRNFSYTNGVRNFPSSLYQNYNPELKPVIANNGVASIPFYRFGALKFGRDPDPGDSIVPKLITNISATNRPAFDVANMLAMGALTATAPSYAITVAAGNGVVAGETFKIHHAGNTYTLTAVAYGGTADTSAGEFVVADASDEATTAANIKATLDVILPPGDLTASVSGAVVTITSLIVGAEGNITATDAMTDVSGSATNATDTGVIIELSGNAGAVKNLNHVMGKVLQVFRSLDEDGQAPALSKVVTTPGMGLSGRDTYGIPAHLFQVGNSLRGNVAPNSYNDAGSLRILIGS